MRVCVYALRICATKRQHTLLNTCTTTAYNGQIAVHAMDTIQQGQIFQYPLLLSRVRTNSQYIFHKSVPSTSTAFTIPITFDSWEKKKKTRMYTNINTLEVGSGLLLPGPFFPFNIIKRMKIDECWSSSTSAALARSLSRIILLHSSNNNKNW